MKAVLFDLDNTLVDFMRLKKICCEEAVEAMIDAGLQVSRKHALKLIYEIYKEFSMEDNVVFQRLLSRLGKKVDYRILSHGIIAYRKAKLGFLKPYPGIKQVLLTLKERGLKLGIVTDAPQMKAWNRLCSMGIDEYFDVVICFEDTRKYKPHKVPFLLALKKLKLNASEVIFVGDYPKRDLVGARRVGMKTGFAKWGEFRKWGKVRADYSFRNVSELLKAVEGK